MTKIIIDPYSTTTQLVGHIPKNIPDYYDINCRSYDVVLPPGVLKHLKRRNHWDEFLLYHQQLPDMISNPDFAGQNPDEPNSVELYKVLGDHLLVSLKLNTTSNLFLGSFYKLDNGQNKITGRLRTKRIHPISFFQ